MSFRTMVFLARRADLTPEQFQHHYDNVHIPLIQKLSGKDFPVTHTRHYFTSFIVGTPQDYPYDAVAEIVFEDESHLMRFLEATIQGKDKELVFEDEARFLNRELMKAVTIGDVQQSVPMS